MRLLTSLLLLAFAPALPAVPVTRAAGYFSN